MIVYNLFPLLAGPLARWPAHFARAAAMGFDWVFVNPIQQPGASGSLYSIADYFQFNPALLDPASGAAPAEQVRQMVAAARAAGLKLMTDLVINHCAVDSVLPREHPDWFGWEPDGGIVHPSCQHNGDKVVWKDLAQFDHRRSRDPEGLYRYCWRVVEHLLALGFTGFRCDAAYQVPHHVWHRLIREVRAVHRHVCFVAETLGCTAEQTKATAGAGFDYVFNSSKWWNFNDWWLIEQYNLVREVAPSISFPESHDTARLSAELDGDLNGLRQRYLFAALFSAGVMIPMGFEYGFRRPLHVVQTRAGDWETTGIDLSSFVGKVNAIKRRHAVFHEESPTTILPCPNPNILLMWKASARQRDEALLILNKDRQRHQEFAIDHFRRFVQSGTPLRDVSPERPLNYIPEPFHYALGPGQGLVFVTSRN